MSQLRRGRAWTAYVEGILPLWRNKQGALVAGGLARGWVERTTTYNMTNTATIAASVTLTPVLTGRLAVRLTGVVNSTDTVNPHNFTISISHGASATPADYTTNSTYVVTQVLEGFGDAEPFAVVVDLDKLAAPVVAPVGSPFQVNACFTADANGSVEILAHGLQLEVTEML